MIPVLVFYYNPESSESSDTFQVQVSDQRETPRKSLFGYVSPCRTGDDTRSGHKLWKWDGGDGPEVPRKGV